MLVGAGALLLAGSGCGNPDAAGEQRSGDRDEAVAPAKPGNGQDKPAESDGGTLPRGQIRDESAGTPKPVSTSNGGRTIRVVGEEGGCSKAAATVAEQTAEKVRISVVETVPTRPGQQCTMDMRYPQLTVQLDEPIGERTVVIQRATSRK